MSILNSQADIVISSDPFNFMVVKNVFEPVIASSLEFVFRELIVNAAGIGKVGEVGELIYDALNFTPRETVHQSHWAMSIATVGGIA